jgi:hypothetical protein
MFHRITGCLLIVLGLSVGAFALSGWLKTDAMAQTYDQFFQVGALRGAMFKAGQWSSHWRFINLLLMIFGSLIVISGLVVFLKNSWGYLLLSCSFAGIGTLPVILRIAGYSRYKWDGGSLYGALPYLAVALAAFLAYIAMERKGKSANI